MRRAIVGTTLVLCLTFVGGTAWAGGNGHGGTHVGRGDPPCTATPNAVTVGGAFTISVSGLAPDRPLNVDLSYPDVMQVFGVGSDNSGNLSLTENAFEAGAVPVTIYDIGGNKPVIVSTCSFTVS